MAPKGLETQQRMENNIVNFREGLGSPEGITNPNYDVRVRYAKDKSSKRGGTLAGGDGTGDEDARAK